MITAAKIRAVKHYSGMPRSEYLLTLGEWRELLRELFSMGISRRTFLDETLDFDMLGIKKHLEKLIEAGHLIDVREYRQSFYDKVINETNQKKDEA
ncbi:hypothetical protein [Chitinophaga sp. LS1]|uniref:hypothetical protein n=1 Tax=Chitinophaga sp. LS1 TaxID=3051176 RepID=UPI002AAAD1AC|nr:hypothetical protein [Chitinophaga sp. LS1]WPV65917.1 hypothetical protein QQL36_29385 [Chitinophaga sp. LS1]